MLVVVLAATNLLTLAALVLSWRSRPRPAGLDDPGVHAALGVSPRPVGAARGTRRLISIEILNPIELAGSRGRVVGIAGSLAPGLTRRIVYDQTLKIMRRQLDEQNVVADVRLHTLRPVGPVRTDTPREQVTRPAPRTDYVDEVQPIDLALPDTPPDQPPVQ